MTELMQEGPTGMISLSKASPELFAEEDVTVSEVKLELLISRYQGLAKQLSTAQDNLKAERQKNERLTAALLKVQGESAAYRDLLDRQQRSTDLVFDLVQKTHFASNGMEIPNMRSGDSHLHDMILAYQHKAQESTESLRLVTSSLAWRVTRPIRWLRRVLINRLGL